MYLRTNTILKTPCQGKKATEPVSEAMVAPKLFMSSSRPTESLNVTECSAADTRRGSRDACRIGQHRHVLAYLGPHHLGRSGTSMVHHLYSYPVARYRTGRLMPRKEVPRGRETRLRTPRYGYSSRSRTRKAARRGVEREATANAGFPSCFLAEIPIYVARFALLLDSKGGYGQKQGLFRARFY